MRKTSKILVRILDVFPAQVPIKVLGTKITLERAEELVRRFRPKGTKLVLKMVDKFDEFSVHLAAIFTDIKDMKKGTIAIENGCLYEEVLLHEIGHFHYTHIPGSANNKGYLYFQKWNRIISDKQEYLAELEAWRFVRNFYGDEFTKKREYMQAFAIRGYRKSAEDTTNYLLK